MIGVREMDDARRFIACAEKEVSRPVIEVHDDNIIASILSGNTDDFEILLKRYKAYIFGIVSKHVPPEHVEDAAHEVFIRIYESLRTYKAEAPLRHWISKIAVRYCYDFWRKQYKSKEVPLSSLSEGHGRWVEAVISEQSRDVFEKEEFIKESREVLQCALQKLTAEERMVITLFYLEELSLKETAALLGWSLINVKVRAHRSRNKLRKILSALVEQKEDHDEIP